MAPSSVTPCRLPWWTTSSLPVTLELAAALGLAAAAGLEAADAPALCGEALAAAVLGRGAALPEAALAGVLLAGAAAEPHAAKASALALATDKRSSIRRGILRSTLSMTVHAA